MSEPSIKPFEKAVEWIVLVAASWFLLAFIGVMLWRLTYPYEIEWLEGAMLRLVQQVAEGGSLYDAPTLEYTMHVYAPLYYWLSAGIWSVAGESPIGPRALSIAASLGTLLLIWMFVRRFGGSRTSAFVGIALYAATFEPGDAYHDTVRVDALFVFFLTLSMYGLVAWRGMRGAVLAGFVCALAFASKQSAMLVPIPMFAACWWARGMREAVGYALAAIVPGALLLLVLHFTTDGWSSYFLLGQLTQHAVETQMIRGFWTHDIGKVVGIPFVAAFVYGLWLLKKHEHDGILLGAAAATWIGIAYASRLHSGGAENVIYPAWVAVAVLGALALDCARSGRIRAVAYGLLVVQFGWLIYVTTDIGRLVPTEADRRAGDGFVAALGAIDGPVLVPFHGWLAEQAGKSSGGHPVAVTDVLRGGDERAIESYRESTREKLESGYYRAIVLDDTVGDLWLSKTVREFYEPVGTLEGAEGYRWINARGTFDLVVYERK